MQEFTKEIMKMKFIKTYAITLVLCFIFVFFGGWMLFDFSNHFYVAVAACAFIIAVILSIFIAQEERIEQLEKRVKELEEKD
jgi:preprotein translocase subunit SecF